MTALNYDCENCDVRWVDPWNTSSLSKGFRTILLQLLPAFKTNGYTRIIVKPLWNADCLIKFCPLGRPPFLFNIRCIMTHNLNFSFEI